MSLRVSALVWRARLPSTQKLVAARLADFADDDGGRVFPSNARLCRECGLSERAVRETVRTLESAGVLVLVALERPGQHLPREYRFDLATLARLDVGDDDPEGRSEAKAGDMSCRVVPDSGGHLVPGGAKDELDQGASGAGGQEVPGGTTCRVVTATRGHVVPDQGAPRAPEPLLDPPREKRTDSPALVPSKPPRTRAAPDADPEGFADWYASYPRKRDPGQARKAYRTALRKTSPAVLLMAARAYAEECRRTGRDPKFIKHPTTWLNAEAWGNPPEVAEGDTDHGRYPRSPSREPRGAAAVEQLLARLGEGPGDPEHGCGDRRGVHDPGWDLELSAVPVPDDPG